MKLLSARPEHKSAPTIHEAFAVARRSGMPLAGLIVKAQAFLALDEAVRRELDDETGHYCRIACVRERTLVLAAPDAAWATRTRLAGPLWLKIARRHWPAPLARCAVRLLPPGEIQRGLAPPRPLSAKVRRQLARAAKLQTDPKLAAVLSRLAAL